MPDISALGLSVDSSQVARGTLELNKLSGAAKGAETAAKGLATGTKSASISAQEMSAATNREASALAASTTALHANATAAKVQGAATMMASHNARNLSFQLIDIGQSIPLLFQSPLYGLQNIGFQVAQIGQIFMGQGGLMMALRQSIAMVGRFALSFAPVLVAVGAVTGLIAGLTHEINQTAAVQVGFFDVATAGWQLFAENVTNLVAPVFALIGQGLADAWAVTAPILKNIGNTIIGTFAYAVKAIGTLWNGLPAAVGDAMIRTAGVIVKGVEWSINKVSDLLNGFLNKYNEGLAAMGQAQLPTFGRVDFGGLANPYAGAGDRLGTDIGSASGAFGTDYLGNAFDAVSQRAQKLAAAKQGIEDMGKAATAANDNLKQLADDGMKDTISQANNLGSTIKDAFKGFISDIRDGKDWLQALGDALGKVADKLLDMALNTIFGSFGAGGTGTGIFGWLGGLFGFAKGGVFNAGSQVQAFAKGGVVSSPTLFPMAKGAGLMGEAGPEAIMPLSRGPDGRLGVTAANNNTPVAANGNSVSFGDIIVQMPPSTGNDTQDEAQAQRIAVLVKAAVNEQIKNSMRAGGLLNPRL